MYCKIIKHGSVMLMLQSTHIILNNCIDHKLKVICKGYLVVVSKFRLH